LVDRHVRVGHRKDLDPDVRDVLRLGAYQLAFLGTPPHAAVSETVNLAPQRARGLVNAVLRQVATEVARGSPPWPDIATRLSYPEWIVDRLTVDLGGEVAEAALRQMDEPARVSERLDGYVQDLSSQWVVEAVAARPEEVVLDLCAAPGGKATALANAGAFVVAADRSANRSSLVAQNVAKLGLTSVYPVVADGRQAPLRPQSFDRVLVDAPCSGLGVLRRRPDARWRIQPEDVAQLARLQRQLLQAGAALARPGGLLAYSVCTMTSAETVEVDDWLARTLPELEPVDPPGHPWDPLGRGARLLPQTAGTDGMYLLLLRVTA
jgi:16S rRNA (cytosine967-C5)-methyltransferase